MMSSRLTLALAALLTVGGCSSPLTQGTPETLSVRSEPAATVLVMGRDMGMTPLTIPVNAVFPAAYPPEQELLYGRITLQRQGCKDYVATVSGKVLSRGLDVQLDCAAIAPPAAVPAPVASPAPAAEPASASQRLRQLDDIRRQGLISDEEYRQLRQRILDTL